MPEHKKEWNRLRSTASASARVLSLVLEQTRAKDGKETQSHHFSNEQRLLNLALAGKPRVDRDALSTEELALLVSLEVEDLLLLAQGEPYKVRKEHLTRLAGEHRARVEPRV